MAFGPLVHRSSQGIVQTYNTKLTRKTASHLSNPESSSICFDREGKKLAVTMLHYLPTIYGLSDPHPLATCSGRNLPDGMPVPAGERTYSNSCTMKHGSFGGPGLETDDLFCSGSDDFRAYLWEIPSLADLEQRRRVISPDDWSTREWPQTIAFTEGRHEPRYVPVELSTPLCRLTGHNSIVNTTVIHPHFLHVVTCGVERQIRIHSPTPSSPCVQGLRPTPSTVRVLDDEHTDLDRHSYIQAIMGVMGISADEDGRADARETGAEMHTIRMFDYILREEGNADVFAMRHWSGTESDSSSEDDSEGNRNMDVVSESD